MILLSGPNISGNEWKYVKDCLDTGWVSSVGSYVNRFEQMVADFAGAKYGIAASCGTAALHISLLLSGVQRDDYVIVPNVTFVASVNSICYTGARPLLVDIDPDSWQMDLDLLESVLAAETYMKDGHCFLKRDDRRIAAIMPVHVLGNMCDMEHLLDIAERYSLRTVEDSTEALGSFFKKRHAGTFGQFGTFSFNGNKIITTGGGGVIVTNDEKLAKQAKHITTTAKSDPFEYIHNEVGFNYRLVNVLAAMGVAQMEQLPKFLERKKEIDSFYRAELGGLGDIRFQKIPSDVSPNHWLFTFRTQKQREILKVLNDNGMQSRPFWVPMNQLEMFKRDLFLSDRNVSQNVYSTCLSIPCSTYITDEEMRSISDTIKNCFSVSSVV